MGSWYHDGMGLWGHSAARCADPRHVLAIRPTGRPNSESPRLDRGVCLPTNKHTPAPHLPTPAVRAAKVCTVKPCRLDMGLWGHGTTTAWGYGAIAAPFAQALSMPSPYDQQAAPTPNRHGLTVESVSPRTNKPRRHTCPHPLCAPQKTARSSRADSTWGYGVMVPRRHGAMGP